MSKDKTNKYYLEENFNCAETILLLSGKKRSGKNT